MSPVYHTERPPLCAALWHETELRMGSSAAAETLVLFVPPVTAWQLAWCEKSTFCIMHVHVLVVAVIWCLCVCYKHLDCTSNGALGHLSILFLCNVFCSQFSKQVWILILVYLQQKGVVIEFVWLFLYGRWCKAVDNIRPASWSVCYWPHQSPSWLPCWTWK